MKSFFRKKTFLIILAMYTVAIVASLVIVLFFDKNKILKVSAGASHNISGWAWNNQAGWISFNSTDCDANDDGLSDGSPVGCPTVGTPIPDYGVHINEVGNFSGYAWSSNAGWISFYKIDSASNPPDNYSFNTNCPVSCNASDNCTACYNSANNKYVYGWAKILALGENEGWLKLRKGSEAGADYGVYIDNEGEFRGWAWNGNDNDIGLGWVSFNCEDTVEGCTGHDYKLSARIPTKPVITSIASDPAYDACNTLKIEWSDVQYEHAFTVERADNLEGPYSLAGGACAGILNQDVSSCLDNTLSAGQTYYFKVIARNIFGINSSDPSSGVTKSICEVDKTTISARGECPKTVHLTWSEPVNQGGVDYYLVQRCRLDTNCDEDSDYTEVTCVDYDPDTNQPTETHCDDNNFNTSPPSEATKKFKYRVAGMRAGERGDWSDPSSAVRPCPPLPKWREVKAE